jgi:tRNA A-37 threonylcarbamoyl transferase component Bud32
MIEFPFQLLIDSAFPKNKRQSLTCTKLLRTIAGRRQVYEAVWNGRAVIVKLFSHRISARRHLKREWRGLRLLQKRQLSSPVPLFYGKTENGGWAVVMGKIVDSSTALEVFNERPEPKEKLNLLILVCREPAAQHQKGVLQKDLHLGNFLVSGDNLFAIDPGQIRFRSQELTRKKSIEQRRGPIVWTSCLATEYIEGKNLYNFLADDSVTEQQRSRAVKQIEELLDNLGKHRIAHGDLKHSNILITANGPTLTDLDAMKVHKWNFAYRIRQRKDLLRFSRPAVG